MENIRPLTVIGLMSGTSIDGVDAAIINTDGIDVFSFGKAITRTYGEKLRDAIRSVLGQDNLELLKDVEHELTVFHADVVKELLEVAKLSVLDVDLIGFHGHTVLHRPADRLTIQIGNGQLLADLTGIDVINRFRNADVMSGGQGAPLVPAYHSALVRDMEKPIAVLNIGGVANVTWIGENGEMLAFDTGTGNALIDDLVNTKLGIHMDYDGAIASAGKVEEKILSHLMANPYFDREPPKSLDRDHFKNDIRELDGMSVAHIAATLTAFTAEAVAYGARKFFPEQPLKWLVCGGGARNPTMMKMLRNRLGNIVQPAKDAGWDGDALEAQAFAFLAARSLFGLPLSFPKTTGVAQSMTGGKHRVSTTRPHKPKPKF